MVRKDKTLIFLLLIMLAIFLVPFIFSFVSQNQAQNNLNLVIISITNLRQDHLGIYGYKRNTTPNIDQFAKAAFVFDNFFTQSSGTLEAGMSLFTSLHGYTHKVMMWDQPEKLNPNIKTFTQLLKEAGYKTAAFTGGGQYKGSYGFSRGFDKYIDDKGDFVGFEQNLDEVLGFLEENKKDRFFLFIQGFDTHCPYSNSPPPYNSMFDPGYKNKNNIDYSVCYWSYKNTQPVTKDGKTMFPLRKAIFWSGKVLGDLQDEWEEVSFERDDLNHLESLYDSSIAYADYQVGQVFNKLKELGLNKNTIIIILSEHGDLFGKNGRFMRGGPLKGVFYDDVLHVPLITKIPNSKEGKEIEGLAQMIDVAPTILDLLGIKKDRQMQGKSLLPLIFDNREVNEYIYAGLEVQRRQSKRYPFTGISKAESIRNKEWKLIKETTVDYSKNMTFIDYELYSIQKDPKEEFNVSQEFPSVADKLKNKLDEWVKQTK